MNATPPEISGHRFCVAPMMKCTDRHCRYFMRLLTKRTRLYTEMITAIAVVKGNRERLLAYHPAEHPLALQLGGSDPEVLRRAAFIAAARGYDELNLNIGCPSRRVRAGGFGAQLMMAPEQAADCIAALAEAGLPVSAKCRTGVNEQESYDGLAAFVHRLAKAGCKTVIVHARKAWLNGLSPRQNRCVPPLRYHWVYRLKEDFPELAIVLNGGICQLRNCEQHLRQVDGVMLGREAYRNPALLAEVDSRLFGEPPKALDRRLVLEEFLSYASERRREGVSSWLTLRHVLGLFYNVPGARLYRRMLTENARQPKLSSADILRFADTATLRS